MSFLKRLFGGKKTEQAVSPRSENRFSESSNSRRDQNGIAYDPDLVPKLKDDHRTLFSLYTKLNEAAERNEYARIPELLSELKLAFQTHVMVENVKFYVYLQQNLANDSEISSFLSDIRKEMDGIARVLVKFVATYSNVTDFNEEKASAFKTELATIGQVLTKRVKLEESELYTLYMPNY